MMMMMMEGFKCATNCSVLNQRFQPWSPLYLDTMHLWGSFLVLSSHFHFSFSDRWCVESEEGPREFRIADRRRTHEGGREGLRRDDTGN